MLRFAGATALIGLILAACQADLTVPADAEVKCESNAQCPGNLICAPGLNQCVEPGSQIEAPELQVSFAEPSHGAQDVSVRPTIVLAFSAKVDLESLAGRVHLNEVGATGVGLVRNPNDLDNVFRYSLAGSTTLKGQTPYELTVDGGVRPAAGELARPLGSEGFAATFQTGPAPDLDAPDPVADLVVDRVASDRTVLRWTSTDPEARVLILRRQAAPVDAEPMPGQSYLIQSVLGASDVVADTTPATAGQWTDIDISAGDPPGTPYYDYVVFAYDDSNNYSAGARAPFAATETVTWCTNETGSAEVEAAGADTLFLHISLTADTYDLANLYPPTGASPSAPLDLPVSVPPLSSDPIAVGSSYFVRPILRGPGGEYRGLERALHVDAAEMEILNIIDVAPGGDAVLTFDPKHWDAVEAEADTNEVASAETWVPVATVGNTLTANLPVVGEYRFRLRPTRTGCADAEWTNSEPVIAGNFSYVDAAATGDGSGLDPANAFTSIQAAVNAATANRQILVAGGTYTEQLSPTTTFNLAVTGSFGPGFRTSDLQETPTIVQSSTSDPAFRGNVTGSSGTFAAFVFSNIATDGCAVDITLGSTVLDHCRIEGPTALCVSDGRAEPTVRNSLITGTHSADSAAARISTDANPIIEHSILDGGSGSNSSTGLHIEGAEGRYEGNEIRGGSGLAAIAVHTTSANTSGINPQVVNNIIMAQGGADSSRGCLLDQPTTVVNNTIDGGNATDPVAVELTAKVRMANNIVFTTGGTKGICYLVRDAGDFGSLFADVFFDCPTARLRDMNSSPTDWDLGSPGGGYEGLFYNEDALDFPTCAYEYYQRDLVMLAGPADAFFAGPGDYHLTDQSPLPLRRGGFDTSTEACGYESDCETPGDCSCGAVTLDKEGCTRSCQTAATDCYSRGAYSYPTRDPGTQECP